MCLFDRDTDGELCLFDRDTNGELCVCLTETLMGSYVPQGQFSSHFSALCWLYGKQLQQRLHYPIGLIEATYSSSNIDEWAPLNVLEDCGVAAGR